MCVTFCYICCFSVEYTRTVFPVAFANESSKLWKQNETVQESIIISIITFVGYRFCKNDKSFLRVGRWYGRILIRKSALICGGSQQDFMREADWNNYMIDFLIPALPCKGKVGVSSVLLTGDTAQWYKAPIHRRRYTKVAKAGILTDDQRYAVAECRKRSMPVWLLPK